MFIDKIKKLKDSQTEVTANHQPWAVIKPSEVKPDAIIKIDNIKSYVDSIIGEDDFDWYNVFSANLPFEKTLFEYGEDQVIYAVQEAQNIFIHILSITEIGQHGMCNFSIKLVCDKNGVPQQIFSDIQPDTIIERGSERIASNSAYYLWVYALNFYHCRNVVLETNELPTALIKARQRRKKPYFERTYTLNITSMKKVLTEEGGAPVNGIKKAFHLCRGHFRTYDENSKGMFGRYKGTFWVPAHTRGDDQVGKIEKHYTINK